MRRSRLLQCKHSFSPSVVQYGVQASPSDYKKQIMRHPVPVSHKSDVTPKRVVIVRLDDTVQN